MKIYLLIQPCDDSYYDKDGKVMGAFSSLDAAKRSHELAVEGSDEYWTRGKWAVAVPPFDGTWVFLNESDEVTRWIEEHEVRGTEPVVFDELPNQLDGVIKG